MRPDQIDRKYLTKYNVNEEDLQQIYESFKIYSNLIRVSRNGLQSDKIIGKPSVDNYLCEHCNKYVRYAIKYHHERSKRHLEKVIAFENHNNN
jgi:hypothetical protein